MTGDVRLAFAWREFCAQLAEAGEVLLREKAPGTPLDQAEGLRYLSRLTRTALNMTVDSSDPDFPRLFKRGVARAGASPLASGSWEALRTILVVTVWTLGLALAGILVNLGLFVASLPEILRLADAGSDAIQGGGVLAILLQLVVLLFLTGPLAPRSILP